MRFEFGSVPPANLIGKTFFNVERIDASALNGDGIVFWETKDAATYALTHYQDCCESVYVEDIAGDLSDLVGSPITMCEFVSNADEPGPVDRRDESFTWTFVKLATIKGYVTIRFYGSSNGYYAEDAAFYAVRPS